MTLRLLVAVALLSSAVVAYEILLMRLFSIVQWHHFAYMIISLALLGYGASGTFIALARRWLLARFAIVFAIAAAIFGVSAPASFWLAQRIPFNPLEIVWDAFQPIYLVGVYTVLAIPFFAAATAIGLAFSGNTDRAGRIYRYDLLGAGAGALGIVAVMFLLPAEWCLKLIGATGLIAGAVASARRRRLAVALTGAAMVLAAAWPTDSLAPRISPYKGLAQALQVPEARIIDRRFSPLGVLTVVASPRVPLRHAPGLSLLAEAPIPPQLGVFIDGDSMTAITRFEGDREAIAYLDFQSAALPYHLLDRPKVLVVGAGGGSDVLRAHYHGARAIDAIELNPQMIDLVRRDHGAFAGHLFDRPEVRLHRAEARGFVATTEDRFDLIEIALLDSFSASSAGLYALSESTLYTVEAFQAYLAALAPGGILAITRWLKLPPRDSLKLFLTALVALERSGVDDPGRRLALIRSWDTATLLIKNTAVTATEVGAIRAFATARGFDLAYYPGIVAADANRHNVWPEPDLYHGAQALVGPARTAFLDDYKFDLEPATDDRPYFFHFLKWRVVPELLAIGPAGGVPLIEWGYVIVVATLAQAAVVGIVLVLLPLTVLRRGVARPGRWPLGRVAVYFLALGLAFLFIEIAFMQRFVLFLAHPLYAIAVVLAAFLVFAGFGSGFAARLAAAPLPVRPITLAVAGIALFAGLYIAILPVLFDWLAPLAEPARVIAAVALIAPLGFCMGLPFPLGLSSLGADAAELVPWAWGINGCASVLSAVLASVLAVHFGFTVVVALAVGLYLLAAITFPGREQAGGGNRNHISREVC